MGILALLVFLSFVIIALISSFLLFSKLYATYEVTQRSPRGRGRRDIRRALDRDTLRTVGILAIVAAVLFAIVARIDEADRPGYMLPVMVGLIVVAAICAFIARQREYASVERQVSEAQRTGNLSNALQLYARAGNGEELEALLGRELPPWPISQAIEDAANEMVQLHQSIRVARQKGVSESVTNNIANEADAAGASLWTFADRVVALKDQNIETTALRTRFKRETERLEQLNEAAQEARSALVELTLSGDRASAERAVRRLRALAEVADELL